MPIEVGEKLPRHEEAVSVLFIGNMSWLKGLDFFVACAEAGARIPKELRFRLVGDANTLPSAQRQRLLNAGVEIISGKPTDAEFLSYIRNTDFLWCCYAPEYDQSSGIFGRALQLGVPAIVRRRSLLEHYMDRYGQGLVVEYGDTAGVIEGVRGRIAPPSLPEASEAMRALSVARLRAACGVSGER
jgi:hypothetical protein